MSSPTSTVLITGATAGIGRHAALHLARCGHRVIATGRNRDALAALAAEARDIEVLRLDVTDPQSIAEAVMEVDRLTGNTGLDVLVNNAGYAGAGPLAEVSDADLRAQFETNVFGLMAVTRAFLPRMMDRQAGRVLNVSSVSGRVPAPLLGPYHASKHALVALSDSLRMELRPFGVHVVLIEPGTIATDFQRRTRSELDRSRVVSSRYAGVYRRTGELLDGFARSAAGPEHVSQIIEQAIEADRPAARYVTPARFWALIAAMNVVPTRWLDAVMCRGAGLTRAALGLDR